MSSDMTSRGRVGEASRRFVEVWNTESSSLNKGRGTQSDLKRYVTYEMKQRRREIRNENKWRRSKKIIGHNKIVTVKTFILSYFTAAVSMATESSAHQS